MRISQSSEVNEKNTTRFAQTSAFSRYFIPPSLCNLFNLHFAYTWREDEGGWLLFPKYDILFLVQKRSLKGRKMKTQQISNNDQCLFDHIGTRPITLKNNGMKVGFQCLYCETIYLNEEFITQTKVEK